MMKIPKKITPCPIIETLFEVRFESALPGDAIFGIIYNAFKNEFPNIEKLPILQLPDAIRSRDPQFTYAPHYRISFENYIFQVGPKVFSLANVNIYAGWETFYEKIKNVFEKIYSLNIIKDIHRLGLRYINFFPAVNIFEKSDLKILLKDNIFVNEVNLLINLPTNGFVNTLRMVSDTEIEISKKQNGSVIDIDTSLVSSKKMDSFTDMAQIIKDAHTEEKKLFFSLLKDEYVKTLNPEYE